MKKSALFSLILVMILCLGVLLTACDRNKDDPTYTVTFDLNGGTGELPAVEAQKAGATVTVPDSSVAKEGYNFLGWKYNGTVYTAGQTFVMPSEAVTLVAEWGDVLYPVAFDVNGGTGTAPTVENQKAGAVVTIPESSVTKRYFTFTGWRYNNTTYTAGQTFTMPAEGVNFKAVWRQNDPTFSQALFSYDRLGAGPLELPLDLQGANLYMVEIDDTAVANIHFRYDADKGCIVIEEDYILSLEVGEHTLNAITDGDGAPAVCKLVIDNSIKTSFDDVTAKEVDVAKEDGVTFALDYNGTTIVSLKQGDRVIDRTYYEAGESTLTVKSEWLRKYCGSVEFTVTLSNHDSYSFTVMNNVIFCTDYDVTTMHNEMQSTTGMNPLYQYVTGESIQIVDAPAGMSGKVLKFTPSAEDNPLNVYGVYTLKEDGWDSTWYNVHYADDKYYIIAFDYMTVDTTTGEFAFRDPQNTWSRELLLGAENDGVVHRFECIVRGSDFGTGTYVWAQLNNGGYVYFDNFSVVEVDSVPTLTASGSYQVGDDYTLAFDAAGYAYTVLLDGERIEATVDAEANTLTVAASTLSHLTSGSHTISVSTALFTVDAMFSVVDNRVSTLRDETVTYSYEAHQPVKVWGTFDDTIEIVSLMQLEKEYDNGYPGGWSFAHNNTGKNYKAYAALTAGQNDEGYITLSTDLLDMLWGTTAFEIEFSNGQKCRFSVEVPDVLMYSDYDNTTIKGWLGGDTNRANTPLSSGFGGSAVVQEDADGNNLLYILSTEGGEANYFNIRLHSHPWEWYNAFGDANHYYRVTFDYKISGLEQNSVYFLIMSLASEDKETNFFGSYDEAALVDGYHEVRFYLNADGETHTFDTGYFTWNGDLRMMRMRMPSFAAEDGKYVAVDNFRLYSTETEESCLTGLGNYVVGQSEAFKFTTALEITSVEVDGESFAYTKEGNDYILSATALDALTAGTHKLTVATAKSRFMTTFTVSDNRVAEITETTKNVYYGMGDVKIAGSFDSTLNVTSVTRQGSDDSWDATYHTPGALKTSYVTLEEDGMVLSGTLINELYGTTTIAVSFDNGKTVSFELVSNVRYFSNYDETNVFIDIGGNSVICQDREMIDVVEADGNHVLKYTPSNATQGHAVGALNGGRDNFCFTVDNRNLNCYNWYDWYPTVGGKLLIFFDYEVITGEKTSHYQFAWQDASGVWHDTVLTGKGHFQIVLDERNVKCFGINCPASTPDEVEGTYMYIDAIGFGEYYNVALGSASDYALGTNTDMTVSFDSKGLAYTVKLDDTVIEVTEDASAQTMTIASSLLEALAAGEHTITVTTVFGEEKVSFTVTEASSET